MNVPFPTLLTPTDRLDAEPEATVDSWWFATRLESDGQVLWAQVNVLKMADMCQSTVSLLRPSDGTRDSLQSNVPLQEVTLSTDGFEIVTPTVEARGDLKRIDLNAQTERGRVDLSLHHEGPALFSGGSGLFPFFGGQTGQIALPGLVTSGTVALDGVSYSVDGARTWLDRQWHTVGATLTPFIWLGLDLGEGRFVSVWDTAKDGDAWLTAVDPDGTHIVTGARRTERADGTWVLSIPGLDAELAIIHTGIPDPEFSFYSGGCTVTGTVRGDRITGHGYVDIIG